MDNIQELVRIHRTRWIEANQYVMPDLADALDFMLTEVAEAMEKRLRQSDYIRNNPRTEPVLDHDIGIEIFDAVMMGCNALDILGLDLMELAREKLAYMDKKRGL